jgi:hypothetical protein
MTVYLFALSFLQLTLLPSLLFHSVFFPKTPLRFRLINALPLSFIFNYIVLFSLFSLKILNRNSVALCVTLEISALFYFGIKKKTGLSADGPVAFIEKIESFYKKDRFLFGVYISAIILLFGVFIFHIGSIFLHWDAVFSWNRWALDWYQSHFAISAHYPQMYPVNWALSYFIVGYPYQYVPKLVMSLTAIISFFTPIIFWRLFRTPGRAILFSLLITSSLYCFLKIYLNDGYVDGPVAVWGFLAFMNLIYSFEVQEDSKYFTVVALLITAFVPLVKQGGWMVLFPILFYYFRDSKEKKITLRNLVILVLFLGFTVGYFVLIEYYIRQGANHSEVGITGGGPYRSQAWYDRGYGALLMILRSFKEASVILLAVLGACFSFLRPSKHRLIYIYWAIYFFGWALFMSYDQRNIILCVPFLLFYFYQTFLAEIRLSENALRLGKVGLILFLGYFMNTMLWTQDTDLLADHDAKTLSIGERRINNFFYDYYSDEKNAPFQEIVGDYPMLVNLRPVREYFHQENMDNLSLAAGYLNNPSYKFIVLHELASSEVRAFFSQQEKEGLVVTRLDNGTTQILEKVKK